MALAETTVDTISPAFTLPADPDASALPEPRLKEYRRLMQRLGVERVEVTGQRTAVDLGIWAHGAIGHAYYKGFLYARMPPGGLVDAATWSALDRPATAYRRIEGLDGWYLYIGG